ncbi:RNA polymerase sigma factor [Frigoribacterium faeni]|uniref:RNA polymerase sigma-70 factor n=1 Tax=Frigoribacterium faeni TaxID=145483 RepID=A0A7W3JKA4_9MICO|nr:sigma-70 family RNA polymerase sigma factor [Frigoribacterium faeni]MBA8814368.1 RNA polymerase sigma-70 factor (ECF subfamily) [Frigoribacterium faeni]BFF15850.1 RNA polymerase sigma-70 factor [Microbacterium flavescens]GEK84512.1 RNA polymerase sigma-70 factor [Frigoribacterium faeni]
MDPTALGDAELIKRASTGNRQALSSLFDRYATAVTRYAWALAPSRMDVEEIVQDTFVTLWKKSGEMTLPNDSLLPWLLVVCRNHALNQRRKLALAAADALPDDLVAPDASEARETLRFVRETIDALSPDDRAICELCLIEGLSYKEAAERLGMTVGAVTKRVSRTRSRLRKAVTNDEH